jgi:hypothetical protein
MYVPAIRMYILQSQAAFLLGFIDQNIGKDFPRYFIISQQSADLICFMAEA